MDEKNYVIAKKGNAKMIKLMNKCIKKFVASKDYDKLCKKYDLSPLEKKKIIEKGYRNVCSFFKSVYS